ncbi:hypothetical protein L2E82_05151 [Cichorium intybus]|uniref:Uncharacterized protein n=1 Tax=Cichorium intybus TaxID=13427 RepID=A0ACB9H7G4_CICIN|nr:hypothetical protein L2E82_05151 [Cichorium intybus]
MNSSSRRFGKCLGVGLGAGISVPTVAFPCLESQLSQFASLGLLLISILCFEDGKVIDYARYRSTTLTSPGLFNYVEQLPFESILFLCSIHYLEHVVLANEEICKQDGNDSPLPPSAFLPCPPTVTFASESSRNPPPLSLLLSTYRPRSPLIPLRLHPTLVSSYSQLFQLPVIHPPSPSSYVPSNGYDLILLKCQVVTLRITPDSVLPVPLKVSSTARFRCYTKLTEEIEAETLTGDNDDEGGERQSSEECIVLL